MSTSRNLLTRLVMTIFWLLSVCTATSTMGRVLLQMSYLATSEITTCRKRVFGLWSKRFSRRCLFPNDSSLQNFSVCLFLFSGFILCFRCLTTVTAVCGDVFNNFSVVLLKPLTLTHSAPQNTYLVRFLAPCHESTHWASMILHRCYFYFCHLQQENDITFLHTCIYYNFYCYGLASVVVLRASSVNIFSSGSTGPIFTKFGM